MISAKKVEVNGQQRFTPALEKMPWPEHHLNFSVIHTPFVPDDPHLPRKSTACPFKY